MIELTAAQVAAFASYRESYLPTRISGSQGFAAAVSDMVAELCALAQAEVCERRRAFFGAMQPAPDFAERIILAEGERIALAGIRYRGLDPTFSFVQISANFNLLDPAVFAPLAAAARDQFQMFEPRGVLVFGPPEAKVANNGVCWAHTIGGEARSAMDVDLPAGLACTFPTEVDFYDEYCAAYDAWQVAAPHLNRFVRLEPFDDLAAAARLGQLASFHDERGWCGAVGVRDAPLFGMPGLYIFEIFLVERWRGRGIGRCIDAALIRHAATPSTFVWEHIHSTNVPSLRVAMAQGRQGIETEYFWYFDH